MSKHIDRAWRVIPHYWPQTACTLTGTVNRHESAEQCLTVKQRVMARCVQTCMESCQRLSIRWLLHWGHETVRSVAAQIHDLQVTWCAPRWAGFTSRLRSVFITVQSCLSGAAGPAYSVRPAVLTAPARRHRLCEIYCLYLTRTQHQIGHPFTRSNQNSIGPVHSRAGLLIRCVSSIRLFCSYARTDAYRPKYLARALTSVLLGPVCTQASEFTWRWWFIRRSCSYPTRAR